ncbi:MAG: ComF family protein [Anaerovoracaceae bacterium]|nr:ComF family protein [Bacillota bacterium]MDY2671190.1 ComF family protein [Anaerovoracaceae bacterium]
MPEENESRLSKKIFDIIFPDDIYCAGCGRPVDRGRLYSLCDECVDSIIWANRKTCRICGKPLESWYPSDVCSGCARSVHYTDGGVVCFVYQGCVRDMIKALKYNGKKYLARLMGRILADRIIYEGLDFDICVPVPMYGPKEKKRGYNQAALIAQFLCGFLDKPFRDDLLVRTRGTRPMNRLSPAARRNNIAGAFSVPAEPAKDVEGRSILLVDDIYTTGSTVNECAKVLKRAGASAVFTAVMASGRNQRRLPEERENAEKTEEISRESTGYEK